MIEGILNVVMHVTTALLDLPLRTKATYYSDKFEGHMMANGRFYCGEQYTGAYNGLPLGTVVEITNLENGIKVMVRIADRKGGKGLDLSKCAFKALGLRESQGWGWVHIGLVKDFKREE